MELTKQRTVYSVNHADTNLKLSGEVTYSNSLITSFNGSITDLSDKFIGNFNYSEDASSNCNCNVSNISKDNAASAYTLVSATVELIKTQLTA